MDKPTDKADRCIFRIQRTKMDKPTDKADRKSKGNIRKVKRGNTEGVKCD